MKRTQAVAGQFYHADAARLKRQVEGFILRDAPKEHAIGILCPHAGLIYSGSVAGSVYSSIEFPKTFILIGPNHTGIGPPASLWHEGQWEIPTGVFSIDIGLSAKILENVPLISRDIHAHTLEHSLEVQLPFISHFSLDVRIVPITLMPLHLDKLKIISDGIVKAIKDVGYKVVVAASSDMSHYVSDAQARQKDRMAIDRILALDPEGLYHTVKKENISMCGYIPAVIMLYTAIALGAKEAKLIKYATSGEVSGDYEQVVGYAGMIVK